MRSKNLRNACKRKLPYLLQKYGSYCYFCKKELKTNEITVEHYFPISRGGDSHIANLRISCIVCNRTKGDKEMICQRCNSSRIANVLAHCSDSCYISVAGKSQSDYPPKDMGFSGGNSVSFEYCLDCGQMQGKFPIPPCKLEESGVDND